MKQDICNKNHTPFYFTPVYIIDYKLYQEYTYYLVCRRFYMDAGSRLINSQHNNDIS